jgi:hypothetical protein
MPTTTNYGWTTPADTDLVKDGASAIRSLGTAIDTTVFNNANAAIPKTIVDAKGDLIVASGSDAVARLAVGTNDFVLTADNTATNGIKWAAASGGGMTLINTGGTTLTGASVTISSIPSTYQDLMLYIVQPLLTSNGENIQLRFNGDSTANRYRTTTLVSEGQLSFNSTRITLTNAINNVTANGLVQVLIPQYAVSGIWKSAVVLISQHNSDGGSTSINISRNLGVYNQTAAITSLTLVLDSNGVSGTAYLYGVK